MASIYLIRHGQASFDSDDYDQLSAMGFTQAKHLGESLLRKKFRPALIVSGTMRRHQETARTSINALQQNEPGEILLQSSWNEFDHQNLIAVLNPDWKNPGEFRRHIKTQADPERYFMTLFAQGIARWTSGDFDSEYSETWLAFRQRIRRGLDETINALPHNGQALVFTSGGPISSLVMSLLNIPDENFLKVNRTLVNCGVTKLVTNASGIYLSAVNDHSVFEDADLQHLITYK